MNTEHVTHMPGGCIRHHWRRVHTGVLGWSFNAAEQVEYWGA